VAAANAIGRLLRDPALAAAMARAGRERAVTSFGYDVLAARLAASLDRLG
jgi:glycosyltransferase involved in cell wall biosynthesis